MVIKSLIRILFGLCFVTLAACGGGGDDGGSADTTAPVITLQGASPLSLSVGDTFTDPGTTASDDVDGSISSSIVVAGDTVNTAIPGTYVVTYNVSDAAGNAATQVTRTVIVSDTTAPVITLLGASSLNHVVGNTFTDPGATASDNVDGNITSNIVVAGDTVNTAIVGSYTVTYNVSDAAGNSAVQLTRTVNVHIVDIIPPVITLLGANPLNLSVGDTFTDPGATATDNIDGNITSNIIVAGDTVNTAIPATYVITYNVSDAAGSSATQQLRTVIVSDNTAPVITLLGLSTLNLSVGDTFTDAGATASDNVDGDITSSIVVAGDTVNTAIPATYTVTYDVSDAAGNPATQQTRTVIVSDNTAPVITLLGASQLILKVGDTFTDPGATATDNIDGDITGNIVVAGDTVNTTIASSYTVTYNVSDAADNPATQLTRTVIVDGTPPVIALLGASQLILKVGDTFTDPGATATDNIDGDITGNIVVAGDTVNTTIASSYTVTYNVSDAADNPATQLTRTVIVDGTPPVITLLGENPLNLAIDDIFIDPGATASDNIDGNISDSIVVAGDTVNTAIAGIYVVTYNVSDEAGNPATQLTRTVNVANTPPVISSFTVNPDPAFTNAAATFSWVVSDVNGDILTCLLDVDNDGATDFTINDCANITSQAHTFALAGDFTARLTVSDGIAAPVESTLNLTVLSPLSTEVSANAPVVSAGRILYTITVGNTSPIPIDNVNVSLTVPAELSFFRNQDAEPNATGCSASCLPTQVASWSLGTLAIGESRNITVNALLGSVLEGAIISFPVTVSATGINNILIDKTVEVFSAHPAELTLSASTDPVTPNQTFSYQMDFGNLSAAALTTLQLRASLPPGVTVSGIISDAGTEVSPGEVMWNVTSLAAGASLRREVTVTADAGLVAGQILQTTASLTHDGGLVVDNIAEHAVTVVAAALPLNVDISTSTNQVVADNRVLYTLTVSNTSLASVDAVSVLLRIPAELSFFRNQDAQPNATGCSPSCLPTQEARFSLGTLAAGESRNITVNALVDVGFVSGNLIAMPVRVTATALGDEINLLKTVAVFGTPAADLALSASTDPVTASQTFSYHLDIGNFTDIGSATLTNLQLRASLPPGVTISAISDSGMEVSPGEVVWDVASLAVGDSLHREVTVTADATLVAGQILQASASLSHDGGLELDNKAEHAVTVVAAALPLNVDISTSSNPVVSGERVLYTLTVSNASLLPVDGVSVLLRVPAELSFFRNQDAQPNATGCSGSCLPTQEAVFSLGTLVAGESRSITVNALVDSGIVALSGNLIITPVRVTATALGDDINLLKTVAVFGASAAELAVSTSTDPVTPNQTFSYHLDVGNTSAVTLTTLQLRASLPPGVTVSAISDAGTEESPGEVVWNVTSLAVGESLRREVTVIADGALVGDILKLHAELSHNAGLERDNAAELAISVVASPSRLSAVITATPDPVTDLLFYSLTVSNVSPLPIDAVNVLLRVPDELSFSWHADAEPNVVTGCSGGCLPTQEAGFTLGTLETGESRGIVINATLAAGLANGTLVTTAVRVTAPGLGHDINLLNTTTVFSAPSAELSLSASTDPVTVNETFTYHLDIGNVSAGALTALQLRASLPPGVTVSGIISDGGIQDVNTGEVVWDIASLATGTALQREVTVIADAAAAGDILKLRAELTHDGGLELDNTAEFALTVAANPSRLSVVIAAAPDPVSSGGILFYTITVTNTFLLPVDAVSVLFSVPSELSFSWHADAEPDVSIGCSGGCNPGQQGIFSLGTIAPSANKVITINATVAAGLSGGTLITAPVRVTATGLPDIINLQHITVIQ